MPSKLWHWYKSEGPEASSASFGLRARSFGGTNGLQGYCKYAHGIQGPSTMVRAHAHFWRLSFQETPAWPPIVMDADAAGRAQPAERCLPGATTSVDFGTALTRDFHKSTECTDLVVDLVCPKVGEWALAAKAHAARAARLATRCKGFVPDAFLMLLELARKRRWG